MFPPTAAKSALPEISYDAPRVKWYPNAEQHPSLFLNEGVGFARPEVQVVPQPASAAPSAQKKMGPVIVEVVSVHGLPGPTLPGLVMYRVTAYYQSEADSSAMESRKTLPEAGTPNPRRKTREDCTFNAKIRVPFNKLEQFMKVGVYRVSLPVDTIVGEATIAIVDPSVEELGEYGLMWDFEEQGAIMLSVRMPRDDDPPEEPPLCTQGSEPPLGTQGPAELAGAVAATAVAAPPPPFSGATEVAGSPQRNGAAMGMESAAAGQSTVGRSPDRATPDGQFTLGQGVEYYSASEESWVPAIVTKIEGYVVTLDYGPRRRVLDTSKQDFSDFVRPPADERVDGDSFFLGLQAHKAAVFAPSSREATVAPSSREAVAESSLASSNALVSSVVEGEEDDEEEDSEDGSESCSSSAELPKAEKEDAPAVYIAPPRFVGYISAGPTSVSHSSSAAMPYQAHITVAPGIQAAGSAQASFLPRTISGGRAHRTAAPGIQAAGSAQSTFLPRTVSAGQVSYLAASAPNAGYVSGAPVAHYAGPSFSSQPYSMPMAGVAGYGAVMGHAQMQTPYVAASHGAPRLVQVHAVPAQAQPGPCAYTHYPQARGS
mmetsp:Transcript_61720/g.200029  ORF Transcript_61720/g.200029 Transcript_61720/m.200029 type:complete len:600 (+) Transcript_61720:193-1992(+)